ncbi:methylmalonyl-CoA mutase small subunit [Mycolicibacterium sp.]|uniref:methylmalonyl-CoA mutase small subunit n=1 Tax=Mycolicibacterium sp. TaxID=2320850 RepID=UPI001A270854|nr:methylmalonyl-CoA mutase small subunit [Mycolicibacterium sp.]MBJ7399436.1 methylmalonyl-CoA mutase small subunit [Mycolicibacterium sp.]
MSVELKEARARWRSAVAAVLPKSSRRDSADLATDPERQLDSPTYEGFDVHALYTALDGLPETPLPGTWPYVRGGDRHRDVTTGWKVAEQFPAAGFVGSPAEGNAAILAALVDGVSALVLRVGDGGVAPGDLARWLEGVYLELAPVLLDAGADFAAAAEVMLALVAGADNSRTVSIDLGADPLTAALSGRNAPTVAEVLAVAATVAGKPGVRTITVDGPAFNDRGANASWELAGVIGAATDYLRLQTGSGIELTAALRQISFRLAADADQFMTIAKFRAARQLWGRVADELGNPDDGAAPFNAVTSRVMMTQRDPWVNMVRTTVAAFGAGVGGADTVQVLPFDAAIPGGFPGVTVDFARRIARNTQLLLLEESNIGRVLDPAGGSWYVEQLTETLAAQAWSHFQEIEVRGGFRQAGGHVAEQIDRVRARRADDIAHRRTAITGVSEFPDLAERVLLKTGPPVQSTRYAAAFEMLRDRADAYLKRTGARPRVLLLPLGPVAEHNIRTSFAANLLAAGGIEAVNPGTVEPGAVGDIVRDAGASVAVICGTDARYDAEVAAIVAAARAAGIGRVYLAGLEMAVAALPPDDRPDDFLTATIDAVEALSLLLNGLGA